MIEMFINKDTHLLLRHGAKKIVDKPGIGKPCEGIDILDPPIDTGCYIPFIFPGQESLARRHIPAYGPAVFCIVAQGHFTKDPAKQVLPVTLLPYAQYPFAPYGTMAYHTIGIHLTPACGADGLQQADPGHQLLSYSGIKHRFHDRNCLGVAGKNSCRNHL